MKKVCVLLADGFEEIEGLTVVDLLRRAKIYVDTVSIMDDYIVHGAHGINVQTERSVLMELILKNLTWLYYLEVCREH
mgnify:CR=1 FL=1